MPIDLLIVGPAGQATGGVARYVTEQQRHVPDDIYSRVYDVGTPENEGRWRFMRAFVRSLISVLLFPFRPRPDIVHVHSSHGLAFYRASAYVLFAAYVWRVPVVLHAHGSSFDRFVRTDSTAGSWYQDRVFDACDRIIALSAYWKDVLAERIPEEKIEVVPNAVNPSEYSPSPEGDPPTIAFVSNHIERKGLNEFITAVDQLKRDDAPPFSVEIAGDGPLSGQAKQLAATYEDVTYHGYVSEERKRQLLANATIYALPTYAEGLPIALLEGMAGGNAVVSTKVGAIPEVVTEENGVLVEPGDADSLAIALTALLMDIDDTRTMGHTNHTLVEETYSWQEVRDRLGSMYRSLVATA